MMMLLEGHRDIIGDRGRKVGWGRWGWAYVSHLLGEKRCKGVVNGRKGGGKG